MAQVGITTAGFRKPIAVGTCRRVDWQSLTDLTGWNACKVARSVGSRVVASMTVQLARSFRSCQRPTQTRARATAATTAQIANMQSAHESGSVMAATLAARDEPALSTRITGKAAIASR